jgi:hypothetical protein
MSRDSSTMAGDSGMSWGKVGRPMNSSNSLAFMEIRLRSLGKAIEEVKTKRVRLEQALRKGHIPESEYAGSLLKLVVESNTLSKEKEQIVEKVEVLRNTSLIQR